MNINEDPRPFAYHTDSKIKKYVPMIQHSSATLETLIEHIALLSNHEMLQQIGGVET